MIDQSGCKFFAQGSMDEHTDGLGGSQGGNVAMETKTFEGDQVVLSNNDCI